MSKILVLNGPNLNLLGQRKPEIYGRVTLRDIEEMCTEHGVSKGFETQFLQSNHEGALIDALHHADGVFAGVIFNPGGYAHTSVALRDAIEAISTPTIEVHISNIRSRESFRHSSLIEDVALDFVCGLGPKGYLRAIDLLVEHYVASD